MIDSIDLTGFYWRRRRMSVPTAAGNSDWKNDWETRDGIEYSVFDFVDNNFIEWVLPHDGMKQFICDDFVILVSDSGKYLVVLDLGKMRD